MKFRVTIEQYKLQTDWDGVPDGTMDWDKIYQQEIQIHIAEKAAREIEKLIADEGLSINSHEIRKTLFKELDETATGISGNPD